MSRVVLILSWKSGIPKATASAEPFAAEKGDPFAPTHKCGSLKKSVYFFSTFSQVPAFAFPACMVRCCFSSS
ncbi:hypothetical protein TH53_18885 [Pedobacter lusitanus]|uniref:Uncharacterized protein n=1 Tax=Pedobacter lusitanus TaxID=1503925 RepID=A0A0D0GHY8_9SPHI|nr:hypothetical protein TH53_18885 [Pedobacter lusitanus]